MNIQGFKKAALTTIAAATMATGFNISAAHAGSGDFWRGVGAGVIGGVVVNEAIRNRRSRTVYVERHRVRRVSSWEAHLDWCYDEYRSYRERDNTYKPYGKRRRQCRSPYSN